MLRSSLTSKRRDVVPGSRLTNGIETSCSGPEPHYDSGIATSCPGRIEMSCSGPVSQAASRCRAQVPLTSNLLSPSTPPPGWHKEGLWGSCLTRMRILRSQEHHNYSIRHLAQQPCDSQLAFGGECRESDAVFLPHFVVARSDATNSRTHSPSGEAFLHRTAQRN